MSVRRESCEVGYVVPTLGTRPKYLKQALHSIRESGDIYIVVVAPESVHQSLTQFHLLYDILVRDPGQGLATAINEGIRNLPESVKFCNWLGDDDLLEPFNFPNVLKTLEHSTNIVMVYGRCTYINEHGTSIWRSASGSYATLLMRLGPQLIPQPGALIRRDAFNQIGGLNATYKWAFDLDLFIRLASIGRLHFVPVEVSFFRWHADSLSVRGRKGSVYEASKIRLRHLNPVIRHIAVPWEFVLRRIIYWAGLRLTRLASRQ